MSARADAGRFDGLDMVRAGAMLLGVLYHGAFAYVPGMGRWYFVEDASTSAVFGSLELVLHAFRMQVFFVLSGLFAHLVLDKRGAREFVVDRFRRLMVPFLLGAPLVVLCDKGLRSWALAWGLLHPEFPGQAEWLGRSLHLWFLEYLFLFVLGAWVLVRVGLRGERARRWLALALTRPELLVGLAVLTWAGVELVGEPNPSVSFIPQAASLVYYLPFFVFGWVLWGCIDGVERLKRVSWLCVPGLAAGIWVYSTPIQWQPLGRALGALVSWLMALGCLGLALRVRRAHRPALTEAVEASYWIYLVHHPLVVVGQILLSQVPGSAWWKYPLLVTAVSVVSYVSYRLLVRPSRWALWMGLRRAPAVGVNAR